MGRGRIEIKKIENSTNRQVTYSKRRNGIIKKAHELTVLCDAKVLLIMYSNTRKFHEYTSPNTTTKKMIDNYQRAMGIEDIWSSHYEKMQENLKRLKEINAKLRREIRQRRGEDLNDLTMEEMVDLQENMSTSLTVIRKRKYHVIETQTGTCKKRVRNLEERHGNLLHEIGRRLEESKYGIVENEGSYESAVAFANGVSNLYAIRLHPSHPNLHQDGGFEAHNLRLA